MRGCGRNRLAIVGLVPALCLLLGAATPAWALDGREAKGADDKAAKQRPNIVVMPNIDVNVATCVKIQALEAGKTQAPPPQTPTGQPAPVLEKPSLVDVFVAIGKLPTVRENIVVVTNVKVNVATWLDLLSPSKTPPPGPKPKPEPKP